ncbi:MAG: hypothetical protein MZW92_14380 [Comamonadaceae bacterium]|nr:hypothetical protein [Comamonadaceae bacterium]
MALAEKLLAHEFNRPGHAVVDHRTYVFLGDGCLMEGISHEACALAGAWKLNKLVALYDDNGISHRRPGRALVRRRRAPSASTAYGWNVIGPVDGHDVDAGRRRARAGQAQSATKPTLIVCKTTIGKGSPNRAGTAKAHGEALGADEIAAHARGAGLDRTSPSSIPDDGLRRLGRARAPAPRREADWDDALRRLPRRASRTGRRVRAPHGRRAAGRLRADRGRRRDRRPHQGRDGGHAQGQPDRAGGLHQGAARDARRLGRPDRLEPDQHQRRRRRCASTTTARRDETAAAATSTTACASSAWPRS